ncbi:hypothetical protein GGI15_000679 [Coemansia interrupta]|uniref:ATP-dependent RNA helicase n=1 Tax=Coemansia interrupta TaxID=1126814 RepID=A0A9W8HLI5_9FUNG|nr:hypothetical protein GGI15_000679 [Coemansia interrupta]
MQRFISSAIHLGPRGLIRLPTAGYGRAAALVSAVGKHGLLPSSKLMTVRLMSSESLAQKQSAALDMDSNAASDRSVYPAEAEPTDEYVPVSFESYTSVHENTKKAIARIMKFKTASKVQDQIISRLPIEGDIMVKAKTGTGKTAAFLVPAIESLVREYEQDPERGQKGRSVGCLIISPTRELAKQIASEAEKLVKFHGWNVQTLVGGESSRAQLRNLDYRRSDIVIGTPGRVLDFLNNQPTFAQKAEKTKLLIFDEADVLLHMGFRKEIEEIIERSPKDRQTFLVSATLDKKIREIAPTVFHRGFELIDCVEKGDANTHHNVKQEYIQANHAQHFPLICDIIQSHIDRNKADNRGSKIVMFLPTTKCADLYASIIGRLMKKGMERRNDNRRQGYGFNARGNMGRGGASGGETVSLTLLHGKLSQETRSRRSDSFRNSPVTVGNTSILVTTDVSARGVDYPDVSMVIQVGIPSEKDAYVHRLGRTGRAGKTGEGVILLTPLELGFLKNLKDIPITESQHYTPELIQSLSKFEADSVKHLASRYESATLNLEQEVIEDAYKSLVAFYTAKGELIGNPRGTDIVNDMAPILDLFDIPQPKLPAALLSSIYGIDRKWARSQDQGNRNSRGSSRGNGDRGNRGYSRNNSSGGSGYGDRGNRGFSRNNSDGGSRGYRGSGGFSRNNNSGGSYGDRGNRGFSRGDRDSNRFNRGSRNGGSR